jgi:hypothetical protein
MINTFAKIPEGAQQPDALPQDVGQVNLTAQFQKNIEMFS